MRFEVGCRPATKPNEKKKANLFSIHTSIIYTAYPLRVAWGMEAIPADSGREAILQKEENEHERGMEGRRKKKEGVDGERGYRSRAEEVKMMEGGCMLESGRRDEEKVEEVKDKG
ncbi:unnamed protein product [Pleuronectes platessa]|uniref:Uncharacterized protein n=1 Tax=Pleuronectes platessa TaxID=8262 RepID=A0A9N7YYL1_PLEPL|nr:unnamed protein product [Pleuronectes platessa]